MVASKLVESPTSADNGDDLLIPELMFAHGEEPVGVRVLTYQSSRAIDFVASWLLMQFS